MLIVLVLISIFMGSVLTVGAFALYGVWLDWQNDKLRIQRSVKWIEPVRPEGIDYSFAEACNARVRRK